MTELDMRETILIVDDEPANIKALAAVLGDQYRILASTSGNHALNLVFSKASELDLILLDVLMPDVSGYDVMTRLRSYPETNRIPVIFITARTDPDEEAQGLDMGAVDYIGKPFHPVIVQARVRTQLELKRHKDNLDYLVSERTQELVRTRKDIVMRLAKAAETRDNETGMHIIRLSNFCSMMGLAWGMTQVQAELFATASLMHDIGKIGIPDSILLKPGKLDPEERNVMETHTTIGGDILADGENQLLVLGREIALTHHERWDGKGYPNGLKGEDITIEGRITSVCDVFDALTSVRPYKKAWSLEEATNFLKENSGSMFDPSLVDLFLENIDKVQGIMEEFKEIPDTPELVSS